MMERTWTVDEEVLFTRYEDAFPFGSPEGHLENCTLARVTGMTAEGHRFMNITPITNELLAARGKEWVAAMVREDARPPEGEPPPTG